MDYLDAFRGSEFSISIDQSAVHIQSTIDEAKELAKNGIQVSILVCHSMRSRVLELVQGTGIQVIDDSCANLIHRFTHETRENTSKKIWVREDSEHGSLHIDRRRISFLTGDGVEEWVRHGDERSSRTIRDVVLNTTLGLLSTRGKEGIRFHTIGTNRGDLSGEILTVDGVGTMVQMRHAKGIEDGYGGAADIIYKNGEKVVIDDNDLFAPIELLQR